MNKRGGKMGHRLPTDLDNIKKKFVPGPGSYNIQCTDMSQSGSFFLSKHVNNRSPRMH